MMTAVEASKLLDKEGFLPFHYLTKNRTSYDGVVRVNVRVIDVRNSYGNDQVRVTPIAGQGSLWVNLDRVRFDESPA
jgi:hypothetical protein